MMTRAPKHVTDEAFRRYLNLFHSTFRDTADQFLGAEKERLLRYGLSGGKIVGYLSTSVGAGFEYCGGDAPSTALEKGSAPVDELFYHAPPSVLKFQQRVMDVRGNPVIRFERLRAENVRPFRIEPGAWNLQLVDSTFVAGSWRREVVLADFYGDRSIGFWSEANAVSRAKDEILIALSDLRQARNAHQEFGDYLSSSKRKNVLVLDDYGDEGRRRLEKIKETLAELGYVPLLLDELPDDLHIDVRQKVVAVGSFCRFVVADDSSKAGQLAELVLADQNRWITIVLRLEGSHSSVVVQGLSRTSGVVTEVSYRLENLGAVLATCTGWAEAKVRELQQDKGKFPWR